MCMHVINYLCVYIILYCSEYEEQLDQHRSELARMRTYLSESENLSQSTDVLRKEIVDLKDQIEVGIIFVIFASETQNVFERVDMS